MNRIAIDNSAAVLDVRDIIARVEQLRAIREPGPVPEGVLEDDDYDTDQDMLFHELASLESFLSELAGYGGDHEWEGDWYPVTLIRESYFTEYAQELAEDIGAIDANAAWPLGYIDWERAASDLRIDYTAADFDGVTYWARS